MSKTIYLAGKVTGLPAELVKAKFEKKEKELLDAGHLVFNPVEHVRENYMGEWNWEDIMKECISFMLGCNEVHLLPDWQQSKGATLERDIAHRLGMTIVYY